ncbi:MAG: histidine phosphatase family protein [Melioribacteraceae bacterium]|nr:histidine phosphatase family protein [Melioribacteraceae bacterium]MCF8262954.1 histidine phosphatase family protein [Melioribacteraceae bacterium]MCF8414345.1 histidine phosphatase family protein [Melioribacteraceae bacterium]MCF8430613.1 histidine phosphatase family protein [Melioribacteraceae bacterium]
MKLLLVRHGETVQNVNKIIQGQSDGELTENGINQTVRLAERLKNAELNQIYSSDLQRTIDTTNAVIKYHDSVKMITDVRLRERYFGNLEGNTFPSDFDWNNLPEGVESNESMYKRAKDFFNDIYKNHSNETVLIVTHGGLLKAFFLIMFNKPVEDFYSWRGIKNTALSIFEIKNQDEIMCRELNSVTHFEDIDEAL